MRVYFKKEVNMICPNCNKNFFYSRLKYLNKEINYNFGFPCPYCKAILVLDNKNVIINGSRILKFVFYILFSILIFLINKWLNNSYISAFLLFFLFILFIYFIISFIEGAKLKIK